MSPSRGYSLWILLSIIVLCSAQVIIQPPENVTEFLNQDAVFTCETAGGTPGWFVNRTLLGNLPPDVEQDLQHTHSATTSGSRMNNLTIPARDVYNETTVQCVVFSLGPLVRSDNVTLYIQGPPSSVDDVRASHNSSSSVTVNWTAPFSLDVTGVDHDIWYSVIIYNVTDENNSTVINCTDCINITDTYYIFTPNPPGLCQSFNFSIIPMNGAGQGERSYIGYDIRVKFERKSITDLQNDLTYGRPLRSVTFRVDSDMIENVTLNDGKGETHVAVDITGYIVTFQLPGDEVYYATFDVDFDCGRKINISQRHFTTYDIQSPKAGGNGNSIHVSGTFINNSTAIGCFLAIECNYTTKISFVALKRNPSDLFVSDNVELPPSYYTVYAHDLEENGLPNTNPANLDFNNITVTESGNQGPKQMTPSTSISQSGSNVTVRCTDEQESGSCLLVYRAYKNSTLSFSDGPFPIELFFNVSVAVNYTFALFRNLSENNNIRIIPFETMMILIEPSGSQTVMPTSSPNPTGVPVEPTGIVVGVVIGLVFGLVFGLVVAIVVIVAVLIRRRKKTMPCSKQVPEDEVNYSSGSFDSQPNLLRLSTDSQRSTTPLIAEDGGRKEKEEEKEESKYATLDTKPSGIKPPPLPLETVVKYEQIDLRATQKLARSPYTEMGPRPSNAPMTMPHIPNIYVEVRPQAQVPVIDPPTVETVMSKLYDKSNEWKEIAEMMEFDEDLIDEIDTNNDADVTCLQVCVEMWVSKFNPTWDHVSHILSQLRERNGERALQEVMKTNNSENVFVVPETSQTNSSNAAVVTGVEEAVFHNDNNNNDDNRGEKKKIFSRNEDQQSMDKDVIVQNLTTLQEDDPSLITCDVEHDEDREVEEFVEGVYECEEVFAIPETSQTTSTPGAVVTGVKETMFQNEDDDNRGENVEHPRNEEQQSVDRAVTVQNHTTLQGDDPSLFTYAVEDEITETGYEPTLTEMVSPVVFPVLCSDDDGSYQLSDDACYVGVNLTTCQPAKQDSMIEGVSVSGDSADEYDSLSLCVGKKETANNTNKTEHQMSFRNTESVQVVAQQCSDYGGFVGAESEEGLRKGEVTIGNDCVDEEQPGCSYLQTKTSSQTEPSFFTREGATVMVTGLMRRSIPTHEEQHHNQSALETSDLMTTPDTTPVAKTTPAATPVAKKLSLSSSSELFPFHFRCYSIHLPESIQDLVTSFVTSRSPTLIPPSRPKREGDVPHVNPRSLFHDLPLPTESRDSTEKPSSPVKTEQWQDPPATASFHQKIVKWMSCGIKLGYMDLTNS